jgi:hypothetical protein
MFIYPHTYTISMPKSKEWKRLTRSGSTTRIVSVPTPILSYLVGENKVRENLEARFVPTMENGMRIMRFEIRVAEPTPTV